MLDLENHPKFSQILWILSKEIDTSDSYDIEFGAVAIFIGFGCKTIFQM